MKAKAAESRIAGFLGQYSPQIAGQLQEARRRLRDRFPRGFELVFDNYNALVFAISATERAADAFVSIAGYPKWIRLFFRDGVKLRDPAGLIEGQGRKIRSVRLETAADLDRRDVRALMDQAIRCEEAALAAAPRLGTIIKSVVARQRPRRPVARQVAKKAARRPVGRR